MIIPIRCFTCGKTIAHLWDDYISQVTNSFVEKELECEYQPISFKNVGDIREDKTCEEIILDKLKIKRYCCRRMFLTNVDLSEKI